MLRKKAEDIEGVSNASLVDLKAVLYKREQDLKRHVPGDKSFSKRVVKRRKLNEDSEDLFPQGHRNRGVEERRQRDEEQWRLESEPTAERCTERLQEKAQQYSQKLHTENSYESDEDDYDGWNPPPKKEESLVDFERKRWESGGTLRATEEEDEQALENLHFLTKHSLPHDPQGIQYSRDALDKYTPGGSAYEEARRTRVDAILQLSKETSQNRSQQANIKQKRLEEKRKRLELIRKRAEQKQKSQESGDSSVETSM